MNVPLPSLEAIKINYPPSGEIIDTAASAALSELTRLAAQICQTPIALISLAPGTQYSALFQNLELRSLVGLPVQAIPDVMAFCSGVSFGKDDLLIVRDTLADHRFATLSLAIAPTQIRFYAGVSLVTSAGDRVGTLCVMAPEPRDLSGEQLEGLQILSRQAITPLELRQQLASQQRCDRQHHNPNCIPCQGSVGAGLPPAPTLSNAAIMVLDLEGRICEWNFGAQRLYGLTQPEAIGRDAHSLLQTTFVQPWEEIQEQLNARGYWEGVQVLSKRDGTPVTVASHWCLLRDSTSQPLATRVINIDITKHSHLTSQESGRGDDGAIFHMTECKVSEEELQKSHREIVNILESITDAFFALDRDWRFTYVNARGEQILSRSRDELIGESIWEVFPELADSTFACEFARAVSDRVTVHFEAFDSHVGIWLETTAYPYENGLSVYVRDVTPLKQADALRSERSHLFAFSAEMGLTLGHGGPLPDILKHCTDALVQHLDVASAGVWILNPASSLLQLEASAGLPLDREIFPEVATATSAIASIAQNRKPCSGSISALGGESDEMFTDSCPLRANFAGYPLIVEDRLVGVIALLGREILTDAVQSLLGWVANGIAVTIDRSWAHEALRSRREGLLFRLASHIRNSLDLDTILETAVHEIRSLLHIDRCHFLWYLPHPSHPSLTVTHEARSAELPSLLREYPAQKCRPLSDKIRNLEQLRIDDIASATDLDENTRVLITNMGIRSQLMLPLETRSGQMGAVVCSHCSGPRPWTEREVELLQAVVDQLALAIDQAELYAQTHAAALAAQTQAQQLSEALQNLKKTQAQLIQTEKMSSLGQMVAGIAHEINNPVNFITGNIVHANKYIQDLLELVNLYQQHYPQPVSEIQEEAEEIDLEFLAEDLPKILASMQMGADRIRSIVLSLRNFSRLDEAEKKPVDIHEGIDNTLLILQHRLKQKGKDPGIEIVKEYGELPRVECYAGQLNQVFMNILNNSMDALEKQPAPHIITIGTEVIRDARGNPSHVVIRIRDNGPGITEDVKKRLFDPFFTTKPVGKGTGLGLSISYQIVVEKHGGVLLCESQPGLGAQFLIQIPVRQPNAGSRCA